MALVQGREHERMMTPEELRLAIIKRRPQYAGRIRINRASRDYPNFRSVTVVGLCTVCDANLNGDVNEEAGAMVSEIDWFVEHDAREGNGEPSTIVTARGR